MIRSSNVFLVPPRVRSEAAESEFEQKTFKLWVEDLPIGNVGQTARLLYDKLLEMNRLDLPPVERIRALEGILKPLQFVLDSLSRDLVREPLPLTRRNALISELVSKLHILVIQGYKAVLDQFHNDSIAGKVLHKGSRAEALHRVLYFFGRSLLSSYRLYQIPPRFIWQEIHGIYHYAVESKLHDKLVDNEIEGEIRKSTITDLYKQILLLALAGPYRLQPGEIGKVYQALLRWVAKVRLINLAHAGPEDGLFLVDIASDNAPKYREMMGDEIIRIGWVIDTSGLASELTREREQLVERKGDTEPLRPLKHPLQIDRNLLAHLLLCWGVGPQRVEDRVRSGGQVTVTCGIESLYGLLGGEEYPELSRSGYRVGTLAESGSRAVSQEPVSRARLSADEYLLDGGSELAAFNAAEGDRGNPAKAATDRQSSGGGSSIIDDEEDLKGVCIKRCNVSDQGENGYHMIWEGESDSRLHVGELVGIKRDDGDGSFRVGVIRWLVSGQDGDIEFGVELFRGDITPIMVKRVKVLENTIDCWRGFMHTSPHQAKTLLAPLFYAGSDDQIFIQVNGQERPVVLGRALESSASFMQFQFAAKATQDKEQGEGGETAKGAGDIDFDDIWEEIK